MQTQDANAASGRGRKLKTMLTNEIRQARTWYERITNKVPCAISELCIKPESVNLHLKPVIDSELGALVIEVENLTGIEGDYDTEPNAVLFTFEYKTVEITIQL